MITPISPSVHPDEGKTMKPWRVQITSSHGTHIDGHVMAKTAREAIVCVLDGTPDDDDIWQAPGWNVQVYPESRAFILFPDPHFR